MEPNDTVKISFSNDSYKSKWKSMDIKINKYNGNYEVKDKYIFETNHTDFLISIKFNQFLLLKNILLIYNCYRTLLNQ